MARTVDGTSTILKGSRLICRAVGKYGTIRFGVRTSPGFAAACVALVAACQAWEALDNYPGEQEQEAPHGYEDVNPE